jgi:CO/xanthine dehydrogenase Mo-binding subunit
LVAEALAQAKAAALIDVGYEILPAVVDIASAASNYS